jgi:hypothetical protein
MDSLLLCNVCKHPAPGHDRTGCTHCRCHYSLENVIEQGLEAARDEIRRLWNTPDGARYGT